MGRIRTDKSFWIELKRKRLKEIERINEPWAVKERIQLEKDILIYEYGDIFIEGAGK